MSPVFRSEPKPGLAPGFFFLVLLCACEPAQETTGNPADIGRPATLSIPGNLEDAAITEASGIVFSRRESDLLWAHNDSGAKARLYAFDAGGKSRGRLKLKRADNKDWEDITAFSMDERAYLLVADIGDNDARRKDVTLYVVAEPDLEKGDRQEQRPEWQIDFRYPNGPRDAEAAAVDIDNQRVLILTKRDLPPLLFEVPLTPPNDGIVDARLLASVATLPRPSRRDIEFAPQIGNWHWQPTAMDIARDGSALVVLTYRAVYYYSRIEGESWSSALERSPLAFDISNIRNAEAIAFSPDGRSLFVTVEKRHAPLIRIDLLGAM